MRVGKRRTSICLWKQKPEALSSWRLAWAQTEPKAPDARPGSPTAPAHSSRLCAKALPEGSCAATGGARVPPRTRLPRPTETAHQQLPGPRRPRDPAAGAPGVVTNLRRSWNRRGLLSRKAGAGSSRRLLSKVLRWSAAETVFLHGRPTRLSSLDKGAAKGMLPHTIASLLIETLGAEPGATRPRRLAKTASKIDELHRAASETRTGKTAGKRFQRAPYSLLSTSCKASSQRQTPSFTR